MDVKQINVKLPENLHSAAESYAKNYGFRNLQELVAESLRERIFEKNEFDETISNEEIELIDSLIEHSIRKKKLISEEELTKVLLK